MNAQQTSQARYNLRKRPASLAHSEKNNTICVSGQPVSSSIPSDGKKPRSIAICTKKPTKKVSKGKYSRRIDKEDATSAKVRAINRNVTDRQSIKPQEIRKTHINQLPTNVIAKIFMNLKPADRVKVERVCHRWEYIARNYAWSNCTHLSERTLSLYFAHGSFFRGISEGEKCKRSEVLQARMNTMLTRCGRYLHTIDLREYAQYLDYKICGILARTLRVQHLELSGVALTNSAIASIGRHLPTLKCISLQNCFRVTRVERGLNALFSQCHQLVSLNLADNVFLTGNPSFNQLPPTLHYLNISHCHRLTNVALANVAEHCSQLTTLMMDRVDVVSSTMLNNLFKRLFQLETFQFNSHDIEPSGVDAGLSSIGVLKRLKRLDMENNVIVTDDMLKSLGLGCKNLVELTLKGSSRHVTDAGLRYLAHLPKLSSIDLSGMRLLTDDTVKEIAKNCPLKKLRLHRCLLITDASIIFMLKKRNKSMSSLDVTYCPHVTDASLRQIIVNLESAHGKGGAPPYRETDGIFSLYMARSGMKQPVPKHLTHPWLRIYDFDSGFDNHPHHLHGGIMIVAPGHFVHVQHGGLLIGMVGP